MKCATGADRGVEIPPSLVRRPRRIRRMRTEYVTYVEKAREALVEQLPGLAREDRSSLLDLYTVLVLIRGESTTLEHVHDAWSVWMSRTRPDHRSIIPFDELTTEVQEMDRKYAEAIQEAARRVSGEGR